MENHVKQISDIKRPLGMGLTQLKHPGDPVENWPMNSQVSQLQAPEVIWVGVFA
jgi:hypothetical protein